MFCTLELCFRSCKRILRLNILWCRRYCNCVLKTDLHYCSYLIVLNCEHDLILGSNEFTTHLTLLTCRMCRSQFEHFKNTNLHVFLINSEPLVQLKRFIARYK